MHTQMPIQSTGTRSQIKQVLQVLVCFAISKSLRDGASQAGRIPLCAPAPTDATWSTSTKNDVWALRGTANAPASCATVVERVLGKAAPEGNAGSLAPA